MQALSAAYKKGNLTEHHGNNDRQLGGQCPNSTQLLEQWSIHTMLIVHITTDLDLIIIS